MNINQDIVYLLSKEFITYDYNNIIKYKLVNKLFNNIISLVLNKIENTEEDILMATQIKYWRPELDQIEYIYNNFMLFDNYLDYDYWNKNSKTSENSNNIVKNEIITCSLYRYTKIYATTDSIEFPIQNYNKSKTSNYISPDLIESYNLDKLKFYTYFIYYFTEDFYYCYGIAFIILPYFDERLTHIESFHSYNKVKKNTLSNHNITKINSIDF
jgi:hypothetical protein